MSEHITGAILQTLVRPQPGKRVSVPIGVASRIALDLLEAVDALRAPWAELFPSADTPEDVLLRSCVHGGLLPDGLLIATFGETMLLEAGLAGVALTIPAIVDHPDVIAYRAPEQLEPGRAIDERADVFTVGILLWEMIAGRSLFGPSLLPRPGVLSSPTKTGSGADPIQVSAARRKVLSHPVPRLDSLPLLKGKVKKDLADFVARCLERDPGLRFQTARDAIGAFAALDATSLSRHDAVVKLVSSLGISESHGAPSEESSGPSSNRPTTPPTEAPGPRVSTPADTEPSRTESEFPPSTDVESWPPSVPPTDSVPMMGSDVESIPPAPATAADSIPVSGNDLESVPPPSRDLDTLPPPPLSAATIAKTDFAGIEGSITLMSGTALPAGHAEPVAAEPEALAAGHTGARPYEIDRGAVGAVTAAAPVVRVLDSAHREDEKVEGRSVEEPVVSERRDRSRKIVVGIMAAAALLVLIAMLRAALSQGDSAAAPAASSSSAATQAVASPVAPSSPATVETSPEPIPSGVAEPRPGTPTSVPGVATAEPAEGPVRKQFKKRPFRPSGI